MARQPAFYPSTIQPSTDKLNLMFLAPSGAQGVGMCVSICPFDDKLSRVEHLILHLSNFLSLSQVSKLTLVEQTEPKILSLVKFKTFRMSFE